MSDEDDDKCAVVVDNGSGYCKAGFSGDDAPRTCFPSIIGKRKLNDPMPGLQLRDYYVGDTAQRKRGILTLNYPIENGIVTNWDDMEKLWRYMYEFELKVQPEDQPVLMSEPALNPNQNREKMTEVMFESFNVPAFYVAIQGILTVYGSGRAAGIVFECGDGVSQVIVVHEGYTVPHSLQRKHLAGRHVTSFLARLLQERGYNFSTSAELEIVRDIKEQIGYVALDFDLEMEKSETTEDIETTYTLPDGNSITVGNERFRCAESIFNPSLMGVQGPGAHQMIAECLQKCDVDLRSLLRCNIILSGGSNAFPGMADRLTKEMKMLSPKSQRVKVVDPPDKKYIVWIGGSLLASLSTFQSRWITKQDYEETGPNVVHMKCIRCQDSDPKSVPFPFEGNP